MCSLLFDSAENGRFATHQPRKPIKTNTRKRREREKKSVVFLRFPMYDLYILKTIMFSLSFFLFHIVVVHHVPLTHISNISLLCIEKCTAHSSLCAMRYDDVNDNFLGSCHCVMVIVRVGQIVVGMMIPFHFFASTIHILTFRWKFNFSISNSPHILISIHCAHIVQY